MCTWKPEPSLAVIPQPLALLFLRLRLRKAKLPAQQAPRAQLCPAHPHCGIMGLYRYI